MSTPNTTLESFIGRQLVPSDNSWSVDLKTDRCGYLAGHHMRIPAAPQQVTIVSEVFREKAGFDYHDFVKVQAEDGSTHKVLFKEKDLLKDGQTLQQVINARELAWEESYNNLRLGY